jgi:hypothetical protein
MISFGRPKQALAVLTLESAAAFRGWTSGGDDAFAEVAKRYGNSTTFENSPNRRLAAVVRVGVCAAECRDKQKRDYSPCSELIAA